jgi:putative ATP-dependent endonuclease of OLD family
MKLVRLRLCNFRSFSGDSTELALDDLTFLLGPNGAGKTAALQALARMFGLDPAQRKVKKSDFHVPHDEKPEEVPVERELWIEADFEFPELLDMGGVTGEAAVPGSFAHMQLMGIKGPARVRYRLHARIEQDDDIEENFTFVIEVDDFGRPVREGRVAKHDRNAIQVHYLPARRDPADHISYSANALFFCAQRDGEPSAPSEHRLCAGPRGTTG